MIGTVLGKYRIEAELSRGGMGAVYRARHEIIDRPVAVKLLRSELTEDPELVTRFVNEAKAASAINHPSIIDVLDFGYTEDGRAYLVMELLEGETLASRVARRRRLPAADAVAIARGIADALSAAHAKGIVHRDLKPDNVFLVADPDVGERPKVLDFGIAKLVDASSRTQHTQTGALMGTPLYMAPEQARSAAAIDERADLYSLGCMLYEMLVGEPPFMGEGAGEIIAMQMFNEPEAPSARVDDIPAALERVVMRLLEKEPGARYATAAETSNALAAALSGRATPARAAPPTTSPNIVLPAPSLVPGLPMARGRAMTAKPRNNPLPLVAVAIMVLLGGAVVLVLRGRSHDTAPRVPERAPERMLDKVAPAPPPVRDPAPPVVITPGPPAEPRVVPITPAKTDNPPAPQPAPPVPAKVPKKKPLPVTDQGSPIETSID